MIEAYLLYKNKGILIKFLKYILPILIIIVLISMTVLLGLIVSTISIFSMIPLGIMILPFASIEIITIFVDVCIDIVLKSIDYLLDWLSKIGISKDAVKNTIKSFFATPISKLIQVLNPDASTSDKPSSTTNNNLNSTPNKDSKGYIIYEPNNYIIYKSNGQVVLVVNDPNSNKILDSDGNPLYDPNGNPRLDPNGNILYDPNDNPTLDPNGNIIFDSNNYIIYSADSNSIFYTNTDPNKNTDYNLNTNKNYTSEDSSNVVLNVDDIINGMQRYFIDKVLSVTSTLKDAYEKAKDFLHLNYSVNVINNTDDIDEINEIDKKINNILLRNNVTLNNDLTLIKRLSNETYESLYLRENCYKAVAAYETLVNNNIEMNPDKFKNYSDSDDLKYSKEIFRSVESNSIENLFNKPPSKEDSLSLRISYKLLYARFKANEKYYKLILEPFLNTKGNGNDKYLLKSYFPLSKATTKYRFLNESDLIYSSGGTRGQVPKLNKYDSIIFCDRSTPVIAPEDCYVDQVGYDESYGLSIILISKDNKNKYSFSNLGNFPKDLEKYKGMTIAKIKKNISFHSGDVVGYVGSSGKIFSNYIKNQDTFLCCKIYINNFGIDNTLTSVNADYKYVPVNTYYILFLLETIR